MLSKPSNLTAYTTAKKIEFRVAYKLEWMFLTTSSNHCYFTFGAQRITRVTDAIMCPIHYCHPRH